MNKSDVIFDLTMPNCFYKGILFAEADNSAMDDNECVSVPQKFAPGIMAIIWVDGEGIWHRKVRLKFPQSGNKQIFYNDYRKQQQQGIRVNETYVLNDIYKFPMINKIWTPNPSGTGEGILEIMKKLDMIERLQIVETENGEKSEK